MMNISEYQLLNMLSHKVGGEPSIAIMIANDALELGKKIFNIEKNIKECQKKMDENNYNINNMTFEEAKKYLICSCGHCNLYEDDLEQDEIEEAIEEAIYRAENQLKKQKKDIFNMMKDYETIMGEPYNIDYISHKLVQDVIKEVIDNNNNNELKKIKKMFDDNEEQESNVIIRTVKKLLKDCEEATTEINKFKIVTCMMCVISNSPIFMNNNITFKNTVLTKLQELAGQISDLEYDKSEYYKYIEKIRE